jgi:hypothetical protein
LEQSTTNSLWRCEAYSSTPSFIRSADIADLIPYHTFRDSSAAGGSADVINFGLQRHSSRALDPFTGKDGYVVVTWTGEIAPDFGGKAALVVYEREGKPLDDFRIVMPGDKRGGRNVRDVVTIAIE